MYLSMDDGHLGCDRNHRRCWTYLADSNPEPWSVVIEDDCIPVDDFNHQLTHALIASTAPVIGLYLGTGYPPHMQPKIREAIDRADAQDACFITTTELLHGVGVAVKTSLIQDMLTYADSRPFDYRIRNWANTRGHRIALSLPSLVDHADQPSLVKHPDGATRTLPRKAWRHSGRDEWTKRSVTL